MKTPEELRAMIDSGISLGRLSAHCSSSLEAYSIFVKIMEERHSLEKLTVAENCVCCGSLQGQPTQLEWHAAIHSLNTGVVAFLMLLVGRISSRHVKMEMKTYHRVCARCTRRVNNRSVIAKLLGAILFFCLIAALFPAVGLSVFAVGLLWYMPDTFRVFGVAALAALIILAGVVWAMGQVRLWAVPAALQQIGRCSFELISANEV